MSNEKFYHNMFFRIPSEKIDLKDIEEISNFIRSRIDFSEKDIELDPFGKTLHSSDSLNDVLDSMKDFHANYWEMVKKSENTI